MKVSRFNNSNLESKCEKFVRLNRQTYVPAQIRWEKYEAQINRIQ
jgi:hypothetical protein